MESKKQISEDREMINFGFVVVIVLAFIGAILG